MVIDGYTCVACEINLGNVAAQFCVIRRDSSLTKLNINIKLDLELC